MRFLGRDFARTRSYGARLRICPCDPRASIWARSPVTSWYGFTASSTWQGAAHTKVVLSELRFYVLSGTPAFFLMMALHVSTMHVAAAKILQAQVHYRFQKGKCCKRETTLVVRCDGTAAANLS